VRERKEEEIEAKRRFRDSGKGRNSINGKKCDGLQAPAGRNICRKKTSSQNRRRSRNCLD